MKTAAVLSALILALAIPMTAHAQAPEPPPAPPWGLLATMEESGIHLEWNEPLGNETSEPALYRVYRFSEESGFMPIAEVTTLTYLDEEADARPFHAYAVTAVTPDEESAPAVAATSSYPYCYGIRILPPSISTTCYLPPPSPLWPPPDFPNVCGQTVRQECDLIQR